jgi:hypothetical protein
MTIHWTFRDAHGRYPMDGFDLGHGSLRTTRRLEDARSWVTAQAARRAAGIAGIQHADVVRKPSDIPRDPIERRVHLSIVRCEVAGARKGPSATAVGAAPTSGEVGEERHFSVVRTFEGHGPNRRARA